MIVSARLSRLFALLALLASVASCSKDVENECPITIDTTETLLSTTHHGKKYYLVKRISGWQDKTEIIQLFDQAPKLGKCNEDLVPPIFEDSLEHDKALARITANLKTDTFQLFYDRRNSTIGKVTLEFED